MKRYLPLIVVILLTLPAIWPLLRPGFFTMHDDQQVVRLAQLDEAVRAGQFPVRWVGDLGFGFGYPLFIFYPPLIYYLAEIFVLVGIGYIVSIKIIFGLSFVLAALSMYLWLRSHFNATAAIVAATFYTYAPYRAVDAYVRGALAESFAFVWPPLILLAVDQILRIQLQQNKKKLAWHWVLVLGISYAALMLTHNLIVLPFTLLLGVYYLICLIQVKPQKWIRFTLNLLCAGVLGLSLSAFFWAPALYEKQLTLVDEILLEEKYDHNLHYVAPKQLWNSIWGYGGSTEGELDGLSFKIGKLHVVVVAVTFAITFAIFLARSLRLDLKYVLNIIDSRQRLSLERDITSLIFELFKWSFLFGISAWMTTRYSALIWDTLSPLQFLQFPWRFLSFTTLFSSAVVGGLFYLGSLIINPYLNYLFSKFKISTYSNFFTIGTEFILAVSLVGLLWLPNLKLFEPQTYLTAAQDSDFVNDDFIQWAISKTSFEFVPKGVETRIDPELGITQLVINREDLPTQVAKVDNGTAEIEVEINTPHRKRIQVSAQSITQITFNVFNFPGWKLYSDGRIVDSTSAHRLQLISTLVTPGQHTLEIQFTNTPVRWLANTITLVTGVILITFMIYQLHRKQ